MRTALFFLSLVGCSAGASAPPVTADPNDADPGVVAVVSPNDDAWVCSGALIAPSVVLTAGHCVVGGNVDKTGWSFEVYFGDDTHHRVAGRTARVAEWHLHPADADLAILLLEAAVDVPPLRWSRETPTARDDARYVGFGAVALEDRGRKHSEAATIRDVADGFLDIDAPARGPCHGDSGGPLLVGGTIYGVASTGDEDCGGGATYTRTDPYADFIGAYMR
jgi:secreted trypsin-like serine protease